MECTQRPPPSPLRVLAWGKQAHNNPEKTPWNVLGRGQETRAPTNKKMGWWGTPHGRGASATRICIQLPKDQDPGGKRSRSPADLPHARHPVRERPSRGHASGTLHSPYGQHLQREHPLRMGARVPFIPSLTGLTCQRASSPRLAVLTPSWAAQAGEAPPAASAACQDPPL